MKSASRKMYLCIVIGRGLVANNTCYIADWTEPFAILIKIQLKIFFFDDSFSWLYILIMYCVLEAVLPMPC